jgi:peptidyl-tRNA hydrolase, PTH2 family
MNDNIKLNGFNNGRDTTDGVGGQPGMFNIMPQKEVKQFIVIRTDLNMSMGKTAAQASHAAMKVFFDKFDNTHETHTDKNIIHHFRFDLTHEEYLWATGLFTKIVKRVKTEAELMKVYNKAKDADLNVSLIKDAALTELTEPAYTAIAIGPNYLDKIEPIVKRLQNL